MSNTVACAWAVSRSRTSGILLHPTSLPGPYGIGTLGEEAHRFASWLAAAGQRVWQVLPLGPTGYGDSPYQCFSAFGGNPLLVDLPLLAAQGLLADEVLPELARIRAPARLLWGRKDVFCTWRDQQILLERIRGSSLTVYEDAGHAIHWEEPVRVADEIGAFIARLPGCATDARRTSAAASG